MKAKRSDERRYFLRELKSDVYADHRLPAQFQRFFRQDILPRLSITGYKRAEKLEQLMQCAFSVLRAGLVDRVVADTRDCRKSGVRLRVASWTALEDAKLVRKCIGSERAGKVTRYQATSKLLKLKKWTPELIHEAKDAPRKGQLLGLVGFKRKSDDDGPTELPFEDVIRAYAPRDKDGEPDEQSVQTGTAITRVVEEFINEINSINLDHAWKARKSSGVVFHPVVELVQLHIGKMYRGVRFYTRSVIGGQNISKADRRRITIDAQETVEVDFSASLPRLAYHLRKLEPPAGDLYAPERIARGAWKQADEADRAEIRAFIKKATIICLNAQKRSDAIGAVHKELVGRKGMLPHIPPASEIVDCIQRFHRPIADTFFRDQGMRLTTVEGSIMFDILKAFVLFGKRPALAIHDGVRVKRQDAQLAKAVMIEMYKRRTGFRPVIKIEE